MKVFLSHRTTDKTEVDELLNEIPSELGFEFIRHGVIEETEQQWKTKVEEKIASSDIVLFFIGSKSDKSVPVSWEYGKAIELGKKYKLVKLSNPKVPKCMRNEKNLLNGASQNIVQAINNSRLKSRDDLLLEQYKFMISSTEKVTEQRSKVNNLFFTVTTSLLSISALVGKLIGFENTETSLLATGMMFFIAVIAFVISFFWSKLVDSYGTLNTGKFKLISEIENKLGTNLFEREWEILQNEVNYKPNSKTEKGVVIGFRIFISIIGVIELLFLANILCKYMQYA